MVPERSADRVHQLLRSACSPGLGRPSGRDRPQGSHSLNQWVRLVYSGVVAGRHEALVPADRPRRQGGPGDRERQRHGAVEGDRSTRSHFLRLGDGAPFVTKQSAPAACAKVSPTRMPKPRCEETVRRPPRQRMWSSVTGPASPRTRRGTRSGTQQTSQVIGPQVGCRVFTTFG
jgi:hypothetical protein